MANVEIPSYKRMTKSIGKENKTENKKEINVPKIGIDEVLVGILSFLMSRVVIISSVSPFGLSFFASGYKDRKSVFVFIGACLGVLTVRQDLDALKYITAMVVFSLVKTVLKKENMYKDALIAGGVLFCSGFVFSLAGYMLTYDLLVLALESFVCGFFVLIFKAATEYINRKRFFSYVSNEQILSMTFVLALSLSGLGRTVNVGYFNLCEILCSVIIMILAMNRGGTLGACGGVVAGVVCALGKDNIMNIVGVYALCGFVAGCVRNTGKIGVCAGFLLSGSCAGFLSSASFVDTANLFNMIMGSALFVALPKKILERIKSFTDGVMIEPDDIMYVKKAKDYITGRLKGLVSSYERLSEAVAVEEDDKNAENDMVKKAVNHAVMSVCAKCGMKNMCWEKQKNLTRKLLGQTQMESMENDFNFVGNFSESFREKCINFSEFANSINHYYSLQRTNELWRKQIIGSRAVISEQYKEFSDVLDNLRREFSGELSGESGYESKAEKKILSKISSLGLEIVNVCVREGEKGHFTVKIKFSDGGYETEKKEIMRIVSEALDMDMNIVNSKSTLQDDFIVLEPIYRYYPVCASATVKKSGNEANGDNIAKENMTGSRFFMSISDGMGSGKKAAQKSRKTNEMLRELINSRYSASHAVKLVNAAISCGDEVFTTVDMAVVDLINGNAEFIKIGAMPSLIIKNNTTEAVFTPNLPIGILNNVDAGTISKKLHKNDMVIMFSDGLCDIKKGFDWITACAFELKNKKPDEICEVILKEAIIRNHGKIKDDMSVIVFKLKENS